jgi:hypothetical protein
MNEAREDYDVIVVGGGAGGVAAAVGASRMGARTLLIERYGFLGGAATNAMVLTYCGFYTSGPAPVRSVGGVGWDLILRLKQMGFEVDPVRSKSGNQIIMIDPEALKVANDRLVLSEAVELNLHTLLVAAHRSGDRIDAITVADHRGLRDLTARAFVDASGEASLSTFAGVPLTQPGGANAHLQPASFPVRIDGVPPEVQFDRALMTDLVARYNQTAEMPIPRADGGVVMRLPVSDDIWWMTVDLATDGISGVDLARAETTAREQAWRFMDVLRQHPGFERAHLSASGPQLGIRESRRPASVRDVTGGEALQGARHPDAIARASWPMEVHEAPGKQRFVYIGGEGFFDIPHPAICAQGASNLRLAGRVVGSDAEAYGSVRVMGTAFATGHAAGISAALFASEQSSASEKVRAALLNQGAIV